MSSICNNMPSKTVSIHAAIDLRLSNEAERTIYFRVDISALTIPTAYDPSLIIKPSSMHFPN
jgi:hypothetical protein